MFHPISKRAHSTVFFKPVLRCLESDEMLFQVFDIVSQTFRGEIQSKSSPNFMTFKIRFQTFLHGTAFLFPLHKLVISLRTACTEL